MTVDATIIHEHIESDLSDDAIARLIADAVDAIDDRISTTGEQTVVLRGGDRYIFVPRPIGDRSDVTEIIERWGATEATLTDEQWRWNGGRTLERLIGTGNIAPTVWGWGLGSYQTIDVVVTYTPKADQNRRDRVTIDLVRLALVYNGLSDERAGDYMTRSREDYEAEREKVISELQTPVMFA